MNVETIKAMNTAATSSLIILSAYGFNTNQEYKLENMKEQNKALVKALDGIKEVLTQTEKQTQKNMWNVYQVIENVTTKRSQKDFDNQIEQVINGLKSF